MDNFYDLVEQQTTHDPSFQRLTQITAGHLEPQDESQSDNPTHPAFGEPVFAIQAFEKGFIFSMAHEDIDKDMVIRCLETIYNQLTDDSE